MCDPTKPINCNSCNNGYARYYDTNYDSYMCGDHTLIGPCVCQNGLPEVDPNGGPLQCKKTNANDPPVQRCRVCDPGYVRTLIDPINDIKKCTLIDNPPSPTACECPNGIPIPTSEYYCSTSNPTMCQSCNANYNFNSTHSGDICSPTLPSPCDADIASYDPDHYIHPEMFVKDGIVNAEDRNMILSLMGTSNYNINADIFFAYNSLACEGMVAGMFDVPSMITSL